MTFSAAVTTVFTVGYLAITFFLCRGLRLNVRSLCYGGLICAATLVLAYFLFYLPTGAAISPGSRLRLTVLGLSYVRRFACVTGWVTGIEGRGAMSRRLQDMGLVRGTRVECLHRSPFGDPAAYLIRGAVIALRQEDIEPLAETLRRAWLGK